MSDKGGSDLDVFDTVTKSPSPRKQTMLGMAVPAPPPPPGSSPSQAARGSLPPPPPPSLRTSTPPSTTTDSPGSGAEEDSERRSAITTTGSNAAKLLEGSDVEEVEPLEETSSPAASTAPDFDDRDDATEVFQMDSLPQANLDSSPESSQPRMATPPPPPMDPAETANTRANLPPSVGRITAPPPPPPSAVSLPPPSRTSIPPRGSSVPPPPPSMPTQRGLQPDEWDDDDDQTTIYSRDTGHSLLGHRPPSHGLLGGTLGTAIPRPSGVPDAPPPPMSRPTAPIPTQSSTPTIQASRARAVTAESPASVPPSIAANRTPLLLAAGVAVLLVIALFFILRPSTGGLVITVAGPGNKPLDVVEVLVDGKVVCTSSPCTIRDLQAGTHMVQARADGYQETAEMAISITSEQDAVHNIRLAKAGGTGVRVTAQGDGLTLFIDGREVGPLPQAVEDLSPGKHRIRVVSDHYATYERDVEVSAGDMVDIGPLALKVTKGIANIVAGEGASGAKVILESDGDRRLLPSLPAKVHIDTSKPHVITATRQGYQTFEQTLSFEDGKAEQTFEVQLTEATNEPARPVRARGPAPAPVDRPAASKPAVRGKATLNINSIPASNIILNGRPLGQTPKVGVSVDSGRHTVLFVKDGQRQSKTVNVEPGQTATVSHRFK